MNYLWKEYSYNDKINNNAKYLCCYKNEYFVVKGEYFCEYNIDFYCEIEECTMEKKKLKIKQLDEYLELEHCDKITYEMEIEYVYRNKKRLVVDFYYDGEFILSNSWTHTQPVENFYIDGDNVELNDQMLENMELIVNAIESTAFRLKEKKQ